MAGFKTFVACFTALAYGAAVAQVGVAADASLKEAEPGRAEIIETVLVTGQQPGPRLWKVMHGEHVMWVLGTHAPLPKGMSWQSEEVEDAIASSAEVLTSGGFSWSPDIGWYKLPFLIPSALRAAKNPDGRKLESLVPAEVYSEWLVLKAKYLGKDARVEKYRPAFAWEKLYGEAFERSGLSYKDEVWPVVAKLARKHRVKITDTTHAEKIKIAKPKAALKEASTLVVADVDCFANSLRTMEDNIESMKQLANAWAIGDLDAYRETLRPNLRGGCQHLLFEAVMTAQFAEQYSFRDFLTQGARAAEEKWLEAAERALANNDVTFAVLPMAEITRPEGRIALLEAKGYVVHRP